MTMELSGRMYDFQIAGDVHADQMSFEVWDETPHAPSKLVLEIVRQDPEGRLLVNCFADGLPLELFEHAASNARQRLLANGWDNYKAMETLT